MLTKRQMEVATLVAKGLTAREIGHRIGLSEPMVKEHISAAAARLPGPERPRHKLTLHIFRLYPPSGG